MTLQGSARFFVIAFGLLIFATIANTAHAQDPLGTVTSAPTYTCPANKLVSNGTCYAPVISCPLIQDYTANVKVIMPPSSVPLVGMAIGIIGGRSDSFFEKAKYGPTIINGLLPYGIGTIEIAFPGTGWQSNANGAGVRAAACRFATLVDWISHNTTLLPSGAVLCASGVSAGGQQIGEGMSHYGLEKYFTVAIPMSGPPFENVLWACDNTQKAQTEFCSNVKTGFYVSPGASVPFIDPAYPGTGACSNAHLTHSSPYDALFMHDSIDNTSGDAVLSYQNTLMIFLFGGQDTSSAPNQGMAYRNAVTSSAITDCAQPAPHAMYNDSTAAAMVVSYMAQYCHAPSPGKNLPGKRFKDNARQISQWTAKIGGRTLEP